MNVCSGILEKKKPTKCSNLNGGKMSQILIYLSERKCDIAAKIRQIMLKIMIR